MKRRARGFSLIELLVVISVIAILLAVGVASYTTVQKKARDSRRRSDMEAVRNGFEQYYALYGEYGAGAGGSCTPMMTAGQEVFTEGFPSDPKPTQGYMLFCVDDYYCACAELEQANGNFYERSGFSDATCADLWTYGASGDGEFYCVRSQQ